MQFTLNADVIIEIAALVAAVVALVKTFRSINKWYDKQEQQSEDIAGLHEEICNVKKENRLLVKAMYASLDGLSQLGANHTVPKAKEELENYINDCAHDTN